MTLKSDTIEKVYYTSGEVMQALGISERTFTRYLSKLKMGIKLNHKGWRKLTPEQVEKLREYKNKFYDSRRCSRSKGTSLAA